MEITQGFSLALQGCQFLDTVEGNSGYGNKLNWQGIANFRRWASRKKIAASHLVWEQVYPVSAFNGVAVAKALAVSLEVITWQAVTPPTSVVNYGS